MKTRGRYPDRCGFVRRLCALTLLFSHASIALAAPPLSLDRDSAVMDIAPVLELLIPEIAHENPLAVAEADGWRPLGSDMANLGIQSAPVWLRFAVINRDDRPFDALLEIAYASLDHVDIHQVQGSEILRSFHTGDRRLFASRPVAHPFFVAPLELPPGQTQMIYIRAASAGPMKLPLSLWQRDAFLARDQLRHLVFGLYFGAMLIMLIYNAFIYLAVGDRTYLYYLGSVAAIGLLIATLSGYAFQFLWPRATQWNQTAVGVLITASVFFGALFAVRFLRLNTVNRDRVTRALVIFVFADIALMSAAVLWAGYATMLAITSVGAALACAAALTLGLYVLWRGDHSARFYVLAWGALLVGALILACHTYGLVPHNAFTQNAVLVGSALMVALLSLALANRINEERRQRYQAQQAALDHERQARQAREEALRTQEKANRELEARVSERTRELRQANRKLEALSSTDALTGLYNRRFFDSFLAAEHGRSCRQASPLSLIFIDIDHFKTINDRHGHPTGDACLVEVARLIRDSVERRADQVARIGGEEFCVVLPDTDDEGARVVAERIRKAVASTPIQLEDTLVNLTVSLGVACDRLCADDGGRGLIRVADTALYESKRTGRNRVTCAEVTPDDQTPPG